ncbi:toll-like receptor 5 [Discoglossus pictus]
MPGGDTMEPRAHTPRSIMLYELAFLFGAALLVFTVGQKCTIINKTAVFPWCNLTHVPRVHNDTEMMMLNFNYIMELDATSFPLLERMLVIELGSQKTNKLIIRKNSFRNLPNLIQLDLADNNILILDPKAFAGLSNLQNLLLSYNNLNGSILENDYFKDLMSLEYLDLNYNKITYLRPNPLFYHLFSFHILNLKLNQISSICEGDLHSFQMKYFSVMDLSSNHLYESDISVWERCGNPFRNIGFWLLILSDNGFTVDKAQKFCTAINGTKIRSLQLNSRSMGVGFGFNHQKDPDNATFAGLAYSHLETLNLSVGSIFNIQPYTFGNLTKLEWLILNDNKINKIEKNAFSGLNSLRRLDLSKNILGEIYDYTFDGLPNITYIDLTGNNIGPITRYAFANLRHLETLDLRDNAIKTITFFESVSFIKYVLLGENKLQTIDTYHVHTSFIDLSSNRLKDLYHLYKVLTFESVNYVILKQNILSECSAKGNIPQNNSLIHLDLSENAFDLIWRNGQCLDLFKQLPKLQVLRLSRNYLSFLPKGIFNDLTSLKTLNLSNNLLTYISTGIFPTNLDTVDLSKNKLLSPNPEVFVSLKTLDITENQFVCDCTIVDLVIWLNQTNTTLSGSQNDIYCMYPSHFLFTPLHTLPIQSCDEEIVLIHLRFSLFVVTTLSIVIFMTSAIVYTHFRGLFFALYKKITMSVLDEQLQRGNPDPCKYDAYMCYSGKDFQWVQNAILKNLDCQYCDQNHFHLCFEERDFIPGEEHIMNIRNAIWNSKKTICIVSKQFLKDGWCVEAFNYAQSRYFSDLKDVMIMVVVGSLSEYELKRYRPIRAFIQRRQYLKWPEDCQDVDWFLSRLSYQILKEEKVKKKEEKLTNESSTLQLQTISTVS